MAIGIDSCAHRGALEAGGLTVAVLGSRSRRPLPAAPHPSLRARSCERGLVLAELPPGTTARRWTFPARNRIMAALGRMTVVVEAQGALRLPDHRRDGAASSAGRWAPSRGGSDPPLRRAPTACFATAPRSSGAPRTFSTPCSASELRAPRPARAPAVRRSSRVWPRCWTSWRGDRRAPTRWPEHPDWRRGRLPRRWSGSSSAGYLRSDSAGRYERTTLAAPGSRVATVTSLIRRDSASGASRSR